MGRGPGHARTSGRLALLALVVVAVGALVFGLGLHDWARPERLARVRAAIETYGAWGPLLFVAGYVVGELLFFPGLPLTLLGGLVFGPVWGTLYVWIAATLSAALAFLVARHLARGTVERWIVQSPRLARIDDAVGRHGWRILMVTRLVPLFPFNLQNYAYGLTRIPFWTYLVRLRGLHLAGNHRVHAGRRCPLQRGQPGPHRVDSRGFGGVDRPPFVHSPMARTPEPGRPGASGV